MTTRKLPSPDQKRRWNLASRYGMTPEEYDAMLTKQRGVCALCSQEMKRPVVDHCHQTGRVRGILCHHCNIKLPVLEDMGWLMLAWAYLEGDEE